MTQGSRNQTSMGIYNLNVNETLVNCSKFVQQIISSHWVERFLPSTSGSFGFPSSISACIILCKGWRYKSSQGSKSVAIIITFIWSQRKVCLEHVA